jgi:hypothetical protein
LEIVPQEAALGAGFQMARGLQGQRVFGLLRKHFFKLLTVHRGHP